MSTNVIKKPAIGDHWEHQQPTMMMTRLRIPSISASLSTSSNLGRLMAPKAEEEDVNNDMNHGDIIDLRTSSDHAIITAKRSAQLGSMSNGYSGGPGMDMNMYATRKTIAQGIMDLGLMCANASQLKYVLINTNQHRYYEVTISLIVFSIILQIIVGIMFIGLGRLNINYSQDRRKADMMNNASVIVIFLVTVVNVLITAFGPSEITDPNHSTVSLNHHRASAAAAHFHGGNDST